MKLTRQTRREMMKSSARLSLAGLSMGAGLLSSSSLWAKPSPRSGQRFKIGACDWTLGKRSNLTTILGRTAAYKRAEVSWEELMKSKERLDPKLHGLKE